MNKNRLDIVMPLDQKDIIQTHAKFILGDKFMAALLDTSKQLRQQNAGTWSLTFLDEEKNLGVRFDIGPEHIENKPNIIEATYKILFPGKTSPSLETSHKDTLQNIER